MIFLSIGDVISMTLAILDRIEVRGRTNVLAMHNAMENLEAIQKALDGADSAGHGAAAEQTAKLYGGEKNDGDDKQG